MISDQNSIKNNASGSRFINPTAFVKDSRIDKSLIFFNFRIKNVNQAICIADQLIQ